MSQPIPWKSIPQMTKSPTWRGNHDWKWLEDDLRRWMDPKEGLCALDLNPDFQRDFVWTPEQQSAYVEYALRGGLSGREIYFNCTGWQGNFKGPFVLVDGKQRLNAVRLFLRGELPVFGGAYYQDFAGPLPRSAFFIFCVNDLPDRAAVLSWYLEMNAGGTPHSKEELDRVTGLLKAELESKQ